MKNLLASLILLLTSHTGFCQIERTDDWKPFYSDDKVVFYAKFIKCEIPSEGLFAEYVLLKAENQTNQEVELIFFTDTYMDGGCTNCDHSQRDRKRSVIIPAKGEVAGECGVGLNNGMRVFSKWLRIPNERVLTQVKVTDVSTNYVH